MMTEKEYVKHKGTKCPWCGSNDIEGAEVNTGLDGAIGAEQEMLCLNCEASWYDHYKLTGFRLACEGREKEETKP